MICLIAAMLKGIRICQMKTDRCDISMQKNHTAAI